VPLDELAQRNRTGTACRHIPDGASYHIFDFRFAGRGRDNRWNRAGQRTLYLARDHGVAIAEFGRHIETHRSVELGPETITRRIYDLRVSVRALLDVRDRRLRAHLARRMRRSLAGAPRCFLDRELASDVAEFVRQETATHALLVPSMAFLDDPERSVLVAVLDKLPPDPQAYLEVVRTNTTFRVERGTREGHR
jgi:RES domain-containing protein